MLLGLVLVVIIISVAMLFAILSSFIPFSNSYGNIAQYTAAYYAAISAVERGSLAVKFANPGFDGESGWKYDQLSNSYSNQGKGCDYWTGDFFSYGDSGATTLYRKIQSSTLTIPNSKKGNVDPVLILSGKNSENYNQLNYNIAELIPLNRAVLVDYSDYYEISPDSIGGNVEGLSGEFRLNPYLVDKFDEPCTSDEKCARLCDSNQCPGENNQMRNQYMPMVDWAMKGLFDGVEFSIIPTDSSSAFTDGYLVALKKDSLIRKGNINQSDFEGKTTISFYNEPQSNVYYDDGHISHYTPYGQRFPLNIISAKYSDMRILENFSDVLEHVNVSNPYLSFELINYLWTTRQRASYDNSHNLYPFLEYRFEFIGGSGSDLYYTIDGEGRVGKYNIKLQVKKPTMDKSAFGNFTIIF